MEPHHTLLFTRIRRARLKKRGKKRGKENEMWTHASQCNWILFQFHIGKHSKYKTSAQKKKEERKRLYPFLVHSLFLSSFFWTAITSLLNVIRFLVLFFVVGKAQKRMSISITCSRQRKRCCVCYMCRRRYSARIISDERFRLHKFSVVDRVIVMCCTQSASLC